MALKVLDCKTEYRTDPLGIDSKNPRFSWRIESEENDTLQKLYRVSVTTEDGTVVWDSGDVEEPQMSEVRYEGSELSATTMYYWTVTVTDNHGNTTVSDKNCFETGLMDGTIAAFSGAKWIGPTEYTLSSDVRSVFGLKVRFKIEDGSTRFGIVFGRGDKRIKDRDNYFKYEIDGSYNPAMLKIYRVGILPEDGEDTPLAEVPICEYDDAAKKPVITSDNLHDEHIIDIQVTGNAAYTFVDDKRIDVTIEKSFFGEVEAPRTLNPIGSNDVNTYPRLNQIGFHVPQNEGVKISLIEVRNLRKPYAVVYKDDAVYSFGAEGSGDDQASKTISTKDGDVFITKDPSHTSIPILRTNFNIRADKIKRQGSMQQQEESMSAESTGRR